MNPMLISTISRQELAERLAVAQRSRMAAQSRGGRSVPHPLATAARRLLASMAAWRMRTQLGATARSQTDAVSHWNAW